MKHLLTLCEYFTTSAMAGNPPVRTNSLLVSSSIRQPLLQQHTKANVNGLTNISLRKAFNKAESLFSSCNFSGGGNIRARVSVITTYQQHSFLCGNCRMVTSENKTHSVKPDKNHLHNNWQTRQNTICFLHLFCFNVKGERLQDPSLLENDRQLLPVPDPPQSSRPPPFSRVSVCSYLASGMSSILQLFPVFKKKTSADARALLFSL